MQPRMIPTTVSVVGVLSFWAAVVVAAPGVGDQVLPKSATLRLEALPGGNAAERCADQLYIGWPAKVAAVNGQWLQISDEGGYTSDRAQRASGWVRKSDVVDINDDDVLSTYADAIEAERSTKYRKPLLARLYWLRGICREAGSPKRPMDPQNALADFEDATCLDSTLAHAWLRRAKLLAQFDAKGNRGQWERYFANAYNHFISMRAPNKTSAAFVAACGRSSSASPSKCEQRPVCDCAHQTLEADCNVSQIKYSPLCPAQLYFEWARALQRLSALSWDTDTAYMAKQARERASRASKKAELKWKEFAVKANKKQKPRARGAEAESELAAAQSALKAAVDATEAEFTAIKAQLKAVIKDVDYRKHFASAAKLCHWARCANPSWAVPFSFEGDMLLDRVNKHGGNDVDETGRLKGALSGADLFAALKLYNASIRLNDQFDEAHRGRAEVLRLLATAPEFNDRQQLSQMLRRGLRFRGLLGESKAQKDAMKGDAVDAALESATKASFLRKDRDAKNLETRGRLEIERSRLVGANLGLLDIARASETFRDAILYAKATADREGLNKQMERLDKVSYFALGYASAVNDVNFAKVRRRAKSMKSGVDLLYGKLADLKEDQYQRLAIAIAEAHRAVNEIDQAEPLETPKSNALTSLLRRLSAVAAPSADKTPQSSTYQEAWPPAFPPRGELMTRNPKIDAWDLMLQRLIETVDDQLMKDAEASSEGKATSPLHNELEQCSRMWEGLGN